MRFRRSFRVLLIFGALLTAQEQERDVRPQEHDVRLPSGKLQRDEILKAEHKKSLDDLDMLVKAAESLKADLVKNDYRVLSLQSLKKADEIEKLARRIKSRLRRP